MARPKAGEKQGFGRVFNCSSQTIIVGGRDATNERGETSFYKLLPRCETPNEFNVTLVAALNDQKILGGPELDPAPAWKIDCAAAHVVDMPAESVSAVPQLRIAGLDCKPVYQVGKIDASGRFATLPKRPWATVLGAGIAGLSAAHELVERGFRVQVIEKSHASPMQVSAAPTDEQYRGYDRGLGEPDIGGIARTQWSTAPMTRTGGLALAGQATLPAVAAASQSALRLKSIHGDSDWYGFAASAWSVAPTFAIPFSGDRLANRGLAAGLASWLNAISSPDTGGSVAAVQLVVVIYRRSAEDKKRDARYGPAAAYHRLFEFLRWFFNPPQAKVNERLKYVVPFPVARMEIDEPFPKDLETPFTGLLIRLHDDLGLVAGEHGFRFFPGFYRHLRDTMKRTPIYDPLEKRFTTQTVHDKLIEVPWQVIDDPTRKHPGAFLRESFSTVGAMLEQYQRLREDLGYRPSDLLRFMLRLLRYMTSSTARRAAYYESLSWWDFLSLRNLDKAPSENPDRLPYGERFGRALRHAPEALVAMKSEFTDARTQGNISTQLAMDQFDLHDHTDSTLSGPTSESWFRHWREYLVQQGVRFFVGEVTEIKVAKPENENKKAKVEIVFPHDKPDLYFDPEKDLSDDEKHYYVCALDAVAVERVTRTLRASHPDCGVIGSIGKLVPDGVEDIASLQNPNVPFQTLTGIQLYYLPRVSFENAHIYYADSAWGLSAVSQIQYWGPTGTGGAGSHLLGNLSIDIGAWRERKAGNGLSEAPNPDDCNPVQIADEVFKQITERRSTEGPRPSYFHIDDYIQFVVEPEDHKPVDESHLRPKWNRAPFLINLVNKWNDRPPGDPWSPADRRLEPRVAGKGVYLDKNKYVWRHRKGGYLVHFNNLVFAGTHMRTFTRLGTMEAANESARHAVNALLDHLVHSTPEVRPTGRKDRVGARKELLGGHPETSDPERVSTPFGDYCDVWDPEENELADLDFLRLIDKHLVEASRVTSREADDVPPGAPKSAAPPHLFDLLGLDQIPDFIDNDIDAAKVFSVLNQSLETLRKAGQQDPAAILGLMDTVRKQFGALMRR